ncbi:MAG: sulfatase [Porticoccaceae bacterium]
MNLIKILLPLALTLSVTYGCGTRHIAAVDSSISDKKPNIVMVVADDMSWFDIGAYHEEFDYVPKNAITPNIDKIAQQGTLFKRAFTATAMCSVTRQQLYTGIYPVRNGAYGNHTRVHEGVKSAAHYFKDLGYRVGLAGKKHIAPYESFPFQMAGEQNRSADGETSFGIEQTREFIHKDSNKAISERQPFFLIVASSSPHDPWTRGDRTQYPEDELQIPSFLNDTPDVRRLMADYLAEVSDLDREVGLIEDELEKADIKDNTIFIFTSEQGSVLPYGKWSNYDGGLRTAFIIRWPGRIAAGATTDAMIEYVDVVPTLTDLVSGTVPLAHDGKPLDGKSFRPVLEGDQDEHKQYVYGIQTTYNIKDGSDYPVRSVRGQEFKLIHNLQYQNDFSNLIVASPWFQRELETEKNKNKANYANFVSRPEFELYNVKDDPFERNNLINDEQYREIVARLKAELSGWMNQQGDTGAPMETAVCQRENSPHGLCPGAVEEANDSMFKKSFL